jgi:hypothetical protein
MLCLDFGEQGQCGLGRANHALCLRRSLVFEASKRQLSAPGSEPHLSFEDTRNTDRAILHAYADGDEIIDAAHHSDLVALLERYDDAITDTPSKIGTGIVRFERRLNVGAGFATPGFWVERADGSWTDFSFPTAISAKPKPQSQEFADACRGVVASDLRAAKLRHFKSHGDEQGRVPCDITGQLITIDEAHLDHAHWPFGTLIAMFREARGWHEVIPTGTLTAPQNQQTTTTFADPAIASAFKAFHRRTATLRVISAKANLSMASQQRRPKIKLPVKLEP